MEGQLYDELLVQLECPICTNYMAPPIRQCATGHSVCETCLRRLPKCALCEGRFTESRNLSLEGLAVKMRYPCINKLSGCAARLAFTDREVHELRCPHKGYKCAMEKCPWVGRLEDIAAHWASKKISSKPYRKKNLCHTKIKTESYYVNMVEAYDKLFWFKCKLTKNRIYWAVQYIGGAAEAEKYYYEIEIFKPGRMRKKILVSDYCQAIDSQSFNDEGCAFVNTDSISSFISADQLLVYYMRVLEVKDDKSQEQGNAQAQVQKADKGNKQRDRSKGPPTPGNREFKKKHNLQKTQQKQEGFVLI